MVKLSFKFIDIAEKVVFSLWGVTILDFFAIFSFDLLKEIDSTLRTVFTLLGAIYFVIQLIFKVLDLTHKRKYNLNLEELQRQKIEMKRMEKEYFELRKDYHTTKKFDDNDVI